MLLETPNILVQKLFFFPSFFFLFWRLGDGRVANSFNVTCQLDFCLQITVIFFKYFSLVSYMQTAGETKHECSLCSHLLMGAI